MIEFIDDFASRVVLSGLAVRSELVGCDDAEISALEAHFNLHLPGVYKEFLRKMGKGAGLFMRGTDIFYRALFENRRAFEEVLALDDNPFPLGHETFVFSSHQGYIFFFFDTSRHEDDPPVSGYMEGELAKRSINESFSSFLLTSLDEQIKGWKNVRTIPR